MNSNKYRGYIASVVSLTAALFMLGGVIYGSVVWQSAARSLTGDVVMSVMVNDSLSGADKTAIESTISSIESIKSHRFIDKSSAAKEFSAYLNYDITLVLGSNPLPGIYSLNIASNVATPDNMEDTKRAFSKLRGVNDVVYESEITERFSSSMNRLRGLLIGFACLLIFVAVIMVHNTMRLMIGASGDEIKAMQFVGARNSVIFAPYISRAVIGGVVAGLLASFALWFGLTAASDVVATFEVDSSMLMYLFSSIVVIGVVLSCGSTYISLYQQINR